MNHDIPTEHPSHLGLESLELRNSLERKLFGEEAITEVGRYVVEGRLGSGAMGTVLRARDPALSRTVAVKVLASSATPANRDAYVDALLAEAKTLAQLNHPNVVAVHDVGTHDGHVFIAMECIEGGTLRDWLASSRGQPGRVATGVRYLEQAARGLAAAHALGIIHRDFKPENVLIGDDGRVRVVDFGLAVSPRTVPELQTSSGDVGDPLATGSGEIVGTPAYMAPEQFGGRHVSEAADQFALCTTLFELVSGRRPHEDAKTVPALAAAVLDGDATLPRDISISRGLRAVIERGLARSAEDRFPSMDALIVALEQLRRRPRRILTGALVVGAGVVGAGVAWGAGGDPGASCRDVGAAADPIWNATRDAELSAAFDETGLPFAGAESRRLGTALTEYIATWKGARSKVCESTYVLQQKSPELHDLEVACLDRSLADVAARVEVYLSANNTIVERAASLAAALPDVERCGRADELMARTPAPTDEAEVSLWADVTAAANRANALTHAGRFDAAREVLVPLEPRVEASSYLPTQAAWFASSSLQHHLAGNPNASRTQARRAFHAAVASGNDEIAAQTATQISNEADENEDRRAARDWASTALSLARRQGGNLAVEVRALDVLGQVEVAEGNVEKGEALFERALQLCRDHELDTVYTTILSDSAAVYLKRGDTSRAISLLEEARERAIEHRGPDHPDVFHESVNLGIVLYVSGKTEDAEALLREAIARQEAVYGLTYARLAYPLRVLSDAHLQRGELEEAVELLRRVLDIQIAAHGLESSQVVSDRAPYAAYLARLGRHEEAAEQVGLASAGARKALEPGSPELAALLVALADALVKVSPPKARSLAVEVQAILETPKGAAGDPYAQANVQWNLIRIFSALDEPERALAAGAAIALAMEANPNANQSHRAAILLDYARVLEKNGRPGEALAQAERAVELMHEHGAHGPKDLEEAEAWVREHRG